MTVDAGPDRGTAAPVIVMWAHPRAVSTAFLRMMIARGDITVVHEPMVTLTDLGAVAVPDGADGTVTVTSAARLYAHLTVLARRRPVFVKDTVEYRYRHLFDHPRDAAGLVHTFIVRHPERTISSHFAMNPKVTCAEIGYEHQWELFCLAREVTGRVPTVISAERLVREPHRVVAAYCAAVGLPYLPHALRWPAQDRTEWSRTRRWHLDVIGSTGFAEPARDYPVTASNDPVLRTYFDHHYPFYQRFAEHFI
ncbi:hypothetical protein O7632_18205 [Solwaraspora sp. WMMD406]|uniref:sulfotransferase-like domain-containing protein n=1 Tax=Solwaraspora sp. WMMD406 TaxID=3016095 RepID=UPI0024161F9F|nr:hypothetical protein [Solwaraspora sp. WMMD406]MDG4766019.1 hypothetical protein [Solwaraspora sp. WMMD406]